MLKPKPTLLNIDKMLIKGDGLRIRITLDQPSTCRYCGCELADSTVSEVYSSRPWYIPNGLRWVRDEKSVTDHNGNHRVLCMKYPDCCGVDPLEYDKPKAYFKLGRVTPFENGGWIKEQSAVFSDDKKYRYQLYRMWEPSLDKVAFIMLNPSVANVTDDDPTTNRCIEFAKKFGYGGLYIVNLYAYVDTVKEHLRGLPLEEARGPENIAHIENVLSKVNCVVYAYGTAIVEPGPEPEWLKAMVKEPYCLEKTKDGFPHHPGRLAADSTLRLFREVENVEEEESVPLPPTQIDVSGTTISVHDSLLQSSTIPLPPSPVLQSTPPTPAAPEPQENKNEYIKFLKEMHPKVKAANPNMAPAQVITAVGHLWSNEQMTIDIKQGNVFINHKNKKVLLDGCGKPGELKAYLDAYRAKYGHAALLTLVDNLPKAN